MLFRSVGGLVIGCDETETEKTASKEALTQANATVGYPEITNFTEKRQLKEILELRDNPKLICYYYTKNTMTGKYVYQGMCKGFGIPYATSYTNPEEYYSNGVTLPLAEPNGMYNQGLSTTATWVSHINDDGEQEVKYIEEEITVSQSKIDKRLCEEWSLPSNY